MGLDPEEMEEAEAESYWLEVDEDGYRVMAGESKEESEEVDSGDDWFTGIVQEVDRDVGEYDDSRLYTFRTKKHNKPINFWGKSDFDRKVDNAALASGDSVAFRFAGTQEVTARDGKEREMHVYDVRYKKL